MARWVVIVAITAVACGGKSEEHGSESREEDPGPSSEEVRRDALAFPDVPDDSVLVHARSNPNGVMDEKGRSISWVTVLLSPSEGSVWKADFYDGRVQVGRWDVDLVDCFAALPIPATPGSDVLVPEMEARYAPLDPFPETKERWTARAYHMEHPCMSSSALNFTFAVRSNPKTDEIVSFHYDYSWEGDLLRACEGCVGGVSCCD